MTYDLTPVEDHDGLLLKREDLYRGPYGVNGSKLRTAQYLIGKAKAAGATSVISAASVHSPQSATAAVVSWQLGLPCHIIVGGTTPTKALKHKSIAIAAKAGATISSIGVGYNPALQRAAKDRADLFGGWVLPSGTTTDTDIEEFLAVGASQVANLPDQVETLVMPFGGGNTAAGVLYGLRSQAPSRLKRVVLMGIGPDRQQWLARRLEGKLVPDGVQLEHVPLYPRFAAYSDRMPETIDGIAMHPTYEGKCVRYLNMTEPSWWANPAGKTLFWVVAGELPST